MKTSTTNSSTSSTNLGESIAFALLLALSSIGVILLMTFIGG